MRQRELLEFRTPQHPSLGTNNWGGASPLLARNIPKEALEQRYSRFNTIRTRDEIFPAQPDEFYFLAQINRASKHQGTPTPSHSRSRGLFSMLKFPRKEKAMTLGSNSKKRWFPRWDPKNRWPQVFSPSNTIPAFVHGLNYRIIHACSVFELDPLNGGEDGEGEGIKADRGLRWLCGVDAKVRIRSVDG
ncbi:hypothetical protein GH714_027551 [Hevea brasiliensis]|uniref:Uncharacterized protein n=1 Tax=Hevea brasiliensis TaxID=3981 RepID=A0A6A6N568_HEVBR|nr:hypothetical protein GH714_027551 [Hevea brasiliensis]